MSKEWFIKEGGRVCFKSDNAELNGWDIQSLVDCLNGKEIKIADLEAKLAESKETINNLEQQCLICNKDTENEQLKQQLAEKDKEIEELKEQRHIYLKRSVEECNKITSLEFELQHEHQDKISFAVEKLVNIQKYITDNAVFVEEECFGREINEFIDNQIKEIKKEMK